MATVTETMVLDYLKSNAHGLSIAEAFINWQLSGGHISKLISNLRKRDDVKIKSQWRTNKITKRRYVRYILESE